VRYRFAFTSEPFAFSNLLVGVELRKVSSAAKEVRILLEMSALPVPASLGESTPFGKRDKNKAMLLCRGLKNVSVPFPYRKSGRMPVHLAASNTFRSSGPGKAWVP